MTNKDKSNPSTSSLSKAEAVKELWRRGNLSWKLKKHQRDLYDLFYNSPHQTQVWLLARRSGKSFTLALLAIEACIKNPNTIVKFLSPTKIQVNNNLRPLMRTILSDCPDELMPEFKTKDYIYYFKNGSEIQLAGSESGHVEKLRGGFSHIAIIDEAQDVTDLKNAVKSVLLPTTLTTNGKVLISGTPPKDPDHEFIGFIEEADMRGTLVRKTIYDNVMLSTEQITRAMEESGGELSEEFQREYLCRIIKNATHSAIPEFTDELEKEVVMEWAKPSFYDSYESMDLGFKDLTVVIFAYYDFKNGKVVIEDELVVEGNQLQLPRLVQDIQQKEKSLWTNPLTHELIKPSVRVSDINYIVTNEIARISNGEVGFLAAKKDDKQAAVNQLRVLLQNKKIIINPRCKTVIRHLKNVRWDKSRTYNIFARSPDNGHYDAVDCLVYLVRHINFNKNPYPIGYGMDMENLYIQNPNTFKNNNTPTYSVNKTASVETYKKIFGIKRK